MESDISDYEEDVIPHFSPLSEYFNDYETIKNLDNTEHEKVSEHVATPSRHIPNIPYIAFNCAKKIISFWYQVLSFIHSAFVPSIVPCYYYVSNNKILKNIKFTAMLVSEDLSMLLNYESEDEFQKHPQMSSFHQQIIQLVGYVALYFIIDSSTMIHSMTDKDFAFYGLYFSCSVLKSILWCLHKISIPVSLLILLMIFHNILELLSFVVLCYFFYKKLQRSENIMNTIKKNLRLIQEAELIARGFTSASIPGRIERLELSTGLPITSPQRQHPELRKYVFIWTKEIFMLYRVATQKLLKNTKFDPTRDFASEALASLDLKEFGDFFRYNIESDTEMQELLRCSDNLSLSSLKTMYFLAELQISEFYKYLYLKISFMNSSDELSQMMYRIHKFLHFSLCLKQLKSEEHSVEEETYKVYRYYRSLEILSDDEKAMNSKNTSLSPLEINMHNMSLHLKSALKRLTDLEELFEANPGSNHPKLLKKAEDMFKEIKYEINAYEEYYQKCSDALQGILNEEIPTDNFSEKEVEQIEALTPIVKCDSEPVIEDEIFEDIATKSCPENEHNFQDYPGDSQRNADAANKLLHELKNVLVIKANEHKTREQIAMAKKYSDKTLVHPTEDHTSVEKLHDSYDTKLETSNDIENTNLAFSSNKSKECDNASMTDPLCIPHSRTLSKKDVHENNSMNDSEENITSLNNVDIVNNPNVQISFAASIAALALQRQHKLGISDDVMFSDGTSSDEEEIQ